MAAVTYLHQEPHRTGPTSRPVLRVVATDPAPCRPTRATFVRRRVVCAVALVVLGVGVVAVTAQAGEALRGGPLAASERDPAARPTTSGDGRLEVRVQPGDSLWSIATRLAPGDDPRPVVDALSKARGGAPLVPGERIVWAR